MSSRFPIGLTKRQPIDVAAIQQQTGARSAAMPGTAPGLIARIAYKLNEWFGPGEPIAPVAPADVGVRQVDFPQGYNRQVRPRAYEAITFGELRALAKACEMVRMAIETRKDQISRLKHQFQLKRDPDEPATAFRDRMAADSRIDFLDDFFKKPDGRHRFAQWMREIVEDILVVDAVSLYPRKTLAGKPYSIEVIDPATITLKIDDEGRLPDPPGIAYQQIIKGMPSRDLALGDIIYDIRNPRSGCFYGLSPVEQIVIMINTAILRSIAQFNFYKEGNIPEGIIEVPADWTPSQIREMQGWWNDLLSGNQANRSRLVFAPAAKVTFTKKDDLKNDWDEWIARFVMFAFSLPPTAFIRQLNRSSSEQSAETAEDEGIVPLMAHIKDFIDTEILEGVFGYDDIEFVWVMENEPDAEKQAGIDKTYVSSGIRSIDEIRVERGWEPLGLPPGIVTATGYVPLPIGQEAETEGGEVLEQNSPEELAAMARSGLLVKKKLSAASARPTRRRSAALYRY